MKNRLSLNRPVPTTALFSVLALTCVTALAQNGPTLVLTEDPTSPLGLTANVGTVKLISLGNVQTWDWLPPSTATLQPIAGGLPVWWIEPDSLPGTPTTYNEVSLLTLSSSASGAPVYGLQIQSDTLLGPPPNTLAHTDGTPVPGVFDLSTGTAQLTVGVQFNDNGDVPSSTVPDGSSTLTLLGGALTLVGAVGRKSGK